MTSPAAPRIIPAARTAVAVMHGYVPGEQPKIASRLIKLNTNENPYPPAPGVLEALRTLPPDACRKYSSPRSDKLREVLAGKFRVAMDRIIVTNGSDEGLRLVAEAFVGAGDKVAYLWPTYSLYPVLVAMQGGAEVRLPWVKDRTPEEALASLPRNAAKVIFLTNPNPPLGGVVTLETISRLAAEHPETLVVVDEAYIAYGGASAIPLAAERNLPNLLVTRTYSKSHSLAGLRVGYAVGSLEVLELLYRIKDSYNVNAASQAAALASELDEEHTAYCVGRICATRDRFRADLETRGFAVPESCGNFLFARVTPKVAVDAVAVFQGFRDRGIVIRYFDTPELRDGVRISIGSEEEMAEVLTALDEILGRR